MPIITLPNQSTAQLQAAVAAQLRSSTSQSLLQLKNQFVTNFNLVWAHPTLSPQEVFDSVGTDAAQLFLIAGTIQAAVNTLVPGLLPQTPPKAYTINADGTVTVTA